LNVAIGILWVRLARRLGTSVGFLVLVTHLFPRLLFLFVA
jgi:hypothetical protein